METCEEFESLISSGLSRDLGNGEKGRLQAHIDGCPSCRSARMELSEVVSMARSALMVEEGLPSFARARIARVAAEQVSRPRGWRLPLSLSAGLQPRSAILVAAMGMIVALLALPLALKPGRMAEPGGEVAVKIDVATAADGAVRLAWSDGVKASYTVYRSTDPRHPGSGEPHRVNGNVWIDRSAGSAQVVYYRIE